MAPTERRRFSSRLRAGAWGLVAMFCLVHADAARAQGVSIDALFGTAANVPTPLTVRQTGFPDINVTAHYDTHPLGPYAPYYSWRVSLWNHTGTGAWEITQVHHRLFLTNNPPEIQFFAIHFGYNFFMAGRAWKRHGFIIHADAGVLVCNPSNTVRGLVLVVHHGGIFDAGYALDGAGAELGVSRELAFTTHLYGVATGALLVGHARVPVVDGSASVPNVSLHAQIGIGVRF